MTDAPPIASLVPHQGAMCLAHSVIGVRGFCQAIKQRAHPQEAAPANNRLSVSLMDIGDNAGSRLRELRCVDRFVGFAGIEQVVNDFCPLSGARLAAANIEVTVDLDAVCVDDFTSQKARQGNCQLGLSRSSRSYDHQKGQRHLFEGLALASWPLRRQPTA